MAEDEDWEELEETEAGESSGGSGQQAVPEGRRVIREQSRKSGSSSRETVYLRRREVVRQASEELRQTPSEEEPEYGPVDVRQQVQRLKNAKKQQAPLEERWGSSRHRRRGAKWIIMLVAAVGVPVVAILVGVSLFKDPPPETRQMRSNVLVLDDPGVSYLPYDSTTPIGWFHEHSVVAFEDAMDILDRCNKATDPRIVGDLLRDDERTWPKMEKWGSGWEVPFYLDDPRAIEWEYGEAGDTGYMWISGHRADYTPFRAYFVRTKEGLKLDWDSTAVWSQVAVQDLVEAAPKHPTLVRVWLAKQPDYDADIGRGSLYSWYLLLDEDKEHFVWAYAPAGSPIDRDIKAVLNYGLIIMPRLDEARVILRLVKPTLGFRESEFEIVELVTEEWVMP